MCIRDRASSDTKSAIGIVANTGSNVTVAGTTTITAGNGGIGVYAEGAGTTVTITNTGNISVGTNGIYMYSKGAALTFTELLLDVYKRQKLGRCWFKQKGLIKK